MALTSSLLSQRRRCWAVAPIRLSSRVAASPTRVTSSQAALPGSHPSASIRKAITALPTRLAAVPSRLIAPSVPGGTGRREVINTV